MTPQDKVYPENLEKVCTKCGLSKRIGEYHKHKRGLYGRQSWCKNCWSLHDRERAEKNIERLKTVDPPQFKICSRPECEHRGELQPASSFTKTSISPDGLNLWCKECTRLQTKKWTENNYEKKKASDKRWREKNRERDRETSRLWVKNNPEKAKERRRKYNESHPEAARDYYAKNKDRLKDNRRARYSTIEAHEYYIQTKIKSWPTRTIGNCRKRAEEKGVPFDLEVHNLLPLPEFCRYFPHIRLDYSAGPDRRHWASVDRIVPALGYTKGNICIVSMAANTWKTNGSNPAERLRIVEIMTGRTNKVPTGESQPYLFDNL